METILSRHACDKKMCAHFQYVCLALGGDAKFEGRTCRTQVWIGLAGSALVQAANDTPPRKAQGRRGPSRRRTGEDAAPPLASLILARQAMQAVE